MFFWRNKAAQQTLENLVNNFHELIDEFRDFVRSENQEESVDEVEENIRISIRYYPGRELSVIFGEDQIFVEDYSQEMFEKLSVLRSKRDVEGIKAILFPNRIETPKEEELKQEKLIEQVVEETHMLTTTGDFEVKGNSVYMVDINRSIPKSLLDRFLKLYIEDRREEFEALKNFWRWIVINPNPAATEDFHRKLIQHYEVPITKEGFILAYRWVVPVNKAKNREYVDFVSNAYVNVRKKKRATSDYQVWQNGSSNQYDLVRAGKAHEDEDGEWQSLGILKGLYHNLPDVQEQTFTDGYSKSMVIKIGEPVKMDRKLCDESGASCSRGLHACFNLKDHELDNSGQSVKLLIAICPRDIVSVPYNLSKFRCCEYLPLAVLGPNDTDKTFIQGGEGLDLLENYFDFKVKELEEQAKNNTVAELTNQRLLPEIRVREVTKDEVTTIVSGLQHTVDITQRIKSIQ